MNRDGFFAYPFIRSICLRVFSHPNSLPHQRLLAFPPTCTSPFQNMNSSRAWNLFGLVVCLAQDMRHNRFCLRLAFKVRPTLYSSTSLPLLLILSASFAFSASRPSCSEHLERPYRPCLWHLQTCPRYLEDPSSSPQCMKAQLHFVFFHFRRVCSCFEDFSSRSHDLLLHWPHLHPHDMPEILQETPCSLHSGQCVIQCLQLTESFIQHAVVPQTCFHSHWQKCEICYRK